MSLPLTASPTVNDRQVGGDHYRDTVGRCPHCHKEIQHWDLFGMLPYLVGCATKYILRFRHKNGKEDLQKAYHYLDKLMATQYPDIDAVQPVAPSVESSTQSYEQVNEGVRTAGYIQRIDDLDAYAAEAAKHRADAYAKHVPNSDIPMGWVLEETADGEWHYRHGKGGQWSAQYASRDGALHSLECHILDIERVQL